MGEIPNRQNWSFSSWGEDGILKDKKALKLSYILYMLARTQRIFEYKNLPETLPQRELERILQFSSFIIIKKIDEGKGDGKIFGFYGGLGGIPNEYYQPTMAIIVNPYLRISERAKIDDLISDNENCVIIWNDSSHVGLYPMFERYASLLAESDISLRIGLINARIPAVMYANDDVMKESAKLFMQNIEEGQLGIIAGKDLFNGLNGEYKGLQIEQFNSKQSESLKQIVETRQYILGSWYNELGLNANFNMKREAINESEADMNEDALLPLIDDMLYNRKKGVEAVNKLYGTNIEVDFSSSWKKIREDIILSQEVKEKEAETVTDENAPEEEEKKEENENA